MKTYSWDVLNIVSTLIAALAVNVKRVIDKITEEMCEKVTKNLTFRMDHLKRSRGQH